MLVLGHICEHNSHMPSQNLHFDEESEGKVKKGGEMKWLQTDAKNKMSAAIKG